MGAVLIGSFFCPAFLLAFAQMMKRPLKVVPPPVEKCAVCCVYGRNAGERL
jgi:hypothetical protein